MSYQFYFDQALDALRKEGRYRVFADIKRAWLYAQMIRWGQAPMAQDLLEAALGVFRSDIYDDVLGAPCDRAAAAPADGIGAFAGPPFDPRDILGHLAPWRIKRGAS